MQHVDMTTTVASLSSTTVGDLRFNNDGVSLTLTGSTTDIDAGGILVTPSVVSGVTMAAAGSFGGNGQGHKLIVFDYGKLTIFAQITGSTNGVTYTGTGLTILNNSGNNYTSTTDHARRRHDGAFDRRLVARRHCQHGGEPAPDVRRRRVGLGDSSHLTSPPAGTGAATQLQFTGSGGFAGYTSGALVNLGGSGTPSGVTWNSGSFVPSGYSLILGSASDTNTVTFENPINFNAAVQTIQAVRGGAAGTRRRF